MLQARKTGARMHDFLAMNSKQTAHYAYMCDVMRRLEWDLHHTIAETTRIPEEWHKIARETPETKRVKVNLRLEADVMRFFRSMGPDHGARINAVLKCYVHARLAGVIKGAETTEFYRNRHALHSGEKPEFGETAGALGEPWPEAPGQAAPTVAQKFQWIRELRAARDAREEGER